jgi:hypothetical protein
VFRIRHQPLPTIAVLLLACLLSLSACGEEKEITTDQGSGAGAESGTIASGAPGGQKFPEIVEADASEVADGVYDFSVTVSSPYDSPERYADGWRVLSPGGEVLGEYELLHNHASEQPFTRTQTGVQIPAEIDRVTIEGRDLENGFGGETLEVKLPS